MKTIIAGSRSLHGTLTLASLTNLIETVIPWKITEVVSGTAIGVDRLGEKWAEVNGIPVKQFPADWQTHGRAAGMIRNEQMGRYADAGIVIIDKGSRGSTHMANRLSLHDRPRLIWHWDTNAIRLMVPSEV